jgi:hypothetical protein
MDYCRFCDSSVEELSFHISHNPPEGCEIVAMALDSNYPPEKSVTVPERPDLLKCKLCNEPAVVRKSLCKTHLQIRTNIARRARRDRRRSSGLTAD